MKPLTIESFLAGAKFQYAQCPYFNPKMWYQNGLIFTEGQVTTDSYAIAKYNDLGFYIDKWNDPDAIVFTEYNDYVLYEDKLIQQLNEGSPKKELVIEITEGLKMTFTLYTYPQFQNDDEIRAWAYEYVRKHFHELLETKYRLMEMLRGSFRVVSFRGSSIYD